MTKARVDRLRQAADELKAARAARPDTSGLGEMTSRTATTKTFRHQDADGTVTGTLVLRGGSGLRVVGACLDCAVAAADCDRCQAMPQPEQGNPWQPPDDEPPADEQPQPVPSAPLPPAAPAVVEQPQQPPAAPRLDPLDSIRADRWSKSL